MICFDSLSKKVYTGKSITSKFELYKDNLSSYEQKKLIYIQKDIINKKHLGFKSTGSTSYLILINYLEAYKEKYSAVGNTQI